MPIVQAKCVMKAWDSKAAILYEPGETVEIDTEGQLATLTTPMGEYVFQYEGHVRVPRKEVVSVPAKTPENKTPFADKPKKKLSDEHKRKLIEGRAAKKARLVEAAA